MKEAVYQTQRTWLVTVAVIGIAVGYFMLLGSSGYPEPGANLVYDIQEFEDLDKIDTPYEEKAPIPIGLEEAEALAVSRDRLYVAGKDAVVVLTEDGQEIGRHAISGTPTCLAVASDGTLFVGMRREVCVLAADGTETGRWTDFTPRSYLTSIAAGDADVFVADAGKRVVYRFDRQGRLLGRLGEKNPAQDVPGLEVPSPYLDLALNEDGELWVVNPGKLGLEQYRADGTIVTTWYRPSLKLDGFPGCCNPTHIAFSPSGRLVTCEKGLVRVKKFEVTSGEFEGLITGSKDFPRQQSIRDIVVDHRDRVLVLDRAGNAIRVFALKEADHGPTSQPA